MQEQQPSHVNPPTYYERHKEELKEKARLYYQKRKVSIKAKAKLRYKMQPHVASRKRQAKYRTDPEWAEKVKQYNRERQRRLRAKKTNEQNGLT